MHRGYIKLWRRLQSNEMWLSEPFTRGQAWVDMLLLANHKDGYMRKRGVRFEVKRGQIGWSEVKLADRWKWSRGKVRRFLNELKKTEQIEQQNSNVSSLISIINYNEYQMTEQQAVQQTDSKRTANSTIDKNDKNEKKETYSADFERIWKIYPVKKGKKTAFERWKKLNGNRPEINELISAIGKQKQSKSWKDGFIPHLTTWLNGARWEDEVEAPQQTIYEQLEVRR